jgi:hypothetical protein
MTTTAHQVVFFSIVHQTLEDIANILDIQKDKLIKSESLTACTLVGFCTESTFLDSFSQDRLDAWFTLFGNDLTIDIAIDEHTIRQRITLKDRSGLNLILDVIHEFEIEVIEIQVTIKKEVLKTRVRDSVHVSSIDAFFFFEETLRDSLTLKQIQEMQKEGVFLPDQHTVIAVLTASGILQGPLLTVFGLKGVSIEELSHLPKIEPTQHAWNRARSLRETTSLWAAPLATTAPTTFLVSQMHLGLEATYENLLGMCDVLSLLQFCVSVREDKNNLWHVSIAHPGGPVIDMASNNLYQSNSTSDMAPSWYRLYRWAFQAESYDKIDIVRELIRHEFRSKEGKPLSQLIPSGSELLEDARANYKIVRHRAFEAYLRSRQEAIEAIQSFMTSTQKDLETLRKDVLDTTLRFSAGIIAFLAANVLQLNLSKFVITVGFGLGLFYLVLAIGFQLFPFWQQYKAQLKEARQIVNAHSELTLAERTRLTDMLPSNFWNTFTKWFVACTVAYIMWAIVLICILMFLLNLNTNITTHQNPSIPMHPIVTPHATHIAKP